MRIGLGSFYGQHIILQTKYSSSKSQGSSTRFINNQPHRLYFDLLPFTFNFNSHSIRSYWDKKSFRSIVSDVTIDHLWVDNKVFRKSFDSGFGHTTFFVGKVDSYRCSRTFRPKETHDFFLKPSEDRLLDFLCFDLILWRPILHFLYDFAVRGRLDLISEFFLVPQTEPLSSTLSAFDNFVFQFGQYNSRLKDSLNFIKSHDFARDKFNSSILSLKNSSQLALSQPFLTVEQLEDSCTFAKASDTKCVSAIRRALKRGLNFKGFGYNFNSQCRAL